jgi:hypothetical protein
MAVYKNSIPFGSIVTDGLILNLDATNINSYPGSGTTWTDTSGYNNSGTLTNGPTFLRERGRGSFVFDGVDDYVSGSNVILTTGGTLIAWFKTSNTYSNNYLLSLPLSSGGNNGFDLGFSGATTFRGIVTTTLGGLRELFYITTYSDNQWHMAALTYSASNAVLYYDGISRTTSTQPSGILRQTANGEFNIARFGSFGGYIGGNISSVQIYNRALSTQEVRQNYNALKSRFGL